ncbi:MAG: hypothetical protein ACKVQA_09870 [Burkholderiales bacterium]
MSEHLTNAESIAKKLQDLAAANRANSRSGDEVIIDQVAEFGGLLVVLAKHLDQAQHTIRKLTGWIAGLTVVLVILTALLVFDALQQHLENRSRSENVIPRPAVSQSANLKTVKCAGEKSNWRFLC